MSIRLKTDIGHCFCSLPKQYKFFLFHFSFLFYNSVYIRILVIIHIKYSVRHQIIASIDELVSTVDNSSKQRALSFLNKLCAWNALFKSSWCAFIACWYQFKLYETSLWIKSAISALWISTRRTYIINVFGINMRKWF